MTTPSSSIGPAELAAIARVEVMELGCCIDWGTAFLIGRRHALTALHVVSSEKRPNPSQKGDLLKLVFFDVAAPGESGINQPPIERYAHLVAEHAHADMDWALIEFETGEPEVPGVAPLLLRSGVLPPAAPFQTFGYARTNPSDGIMFSGHVENATARCAGSPAIQLFCRHAAAVDTRVAGQSGAPVFSGGAVVGIIRAFIENDGAVVAGTVYACPIQAPLSDSLVRSLARTDPCIGVPPLPDDIPVPADPFHYLERYRREEARLFLGRCRELAELARVLESDRRIILLYGQSGVGKSSLLEAGLEPRFSCRFDIRIARRSREAGLIGDLARLLGIDASEPDAFEAAWLGLEASAHRTAATLGAETERAKPILVVLDQVEEAWTRPCSSAASEFDVSRAEVDGLFARLHAHYSAGNASTRVMLSFRKEWLTEIDNALQRWGLPSAGVRVAPVDSAAIEEIVLGIPNTPQLADKYNLEVVPSLAQRIAADLARDVGSAITPALRVVLTNLWHAARSLNREHPVFDLPLYSKLAARGLGLDRFLDERLESLPNAMMRHLESGLALDILEFHTTNGGTAEQRTQAELVEHYGPISADATQLTGALNDAYLLVDAVATGEEERRDTRLAHDMLAPIVRARFASSQFPGQRARRILEARAGIAGRNGMEHILGELDLRLVEEGCQGMRALLPPEADLLETSRRFHQERSRQEEARRRREQEQAEALVEQQKKTLLAELQAAKQVQEVAEQRRSKWVWLGAVLIGFLVIGAGGVAAYVNNVTRARNEARQNLRDASVRLALFLSQRVGQHRNAVQSALQAAHLDRLVRGGQPGFSRPVLVALSASASAATYGGGVRQLDQADAELWSVDHSPLGNRFAVGGDDRVIRVYTNRGDFQFGLPPVAARVRNVRFSPDGLLLGVTMLQTTPQDDSGAVDDRAVLLFDLAARQEKCRLGGHIREVTGLSFSLDGRLVASASEDGSIRLWNVSDCAANGSPLWIPSADGAYSRAVAYSPTEDLAAAGGRDGTVRLLDPRTGAVIRAFAPHRLQVYGVAFSRDGRKLASTSDDKTARIYDVQTGRVQATLEHPSGVWNASFSHDDTHLITAADDGTVHVFDLASNKRIASWQAHNGPAHAVDAAPSGDIVSIGEGDRRVLVWSPSGERRQITVLAHRSGASGWDAQFSPDGRYLLTASSDSKARLWDVAHNYRSRCTLDKHEGGIYTARFSPDGRLIVTASADGTAKLWEAATCKLVSTLVHSRDVRGAVFSRHSDRVLTTSLDGTITVWQIQGGVRSVAKRLEHGPALSVNFSPDGKKLVTSGGNSAQIWDIESRTLLNNLRGHTDVLRSAVFSPDGRQIASVGDDRAVRLWDVATGQAQGELLGHSDWIREVRWTSYGGRSLIVTASADRSVRVWDPASRSPLAILTEHQAGVPSAVLAPDGEHLVSASTDHSARVFEREPAALIFEWPVHSDEGSDIDVTRDGKLIVTAGDDGTAVVMNTANGAVRAVLRGHKGKVAAARFSPDGRTIVTCGNDKTLRLWRSSGEPIALGQRTGSVNGCVFSASGKLIASAGDDRKVAIFQTDDFLAAGSEGRVKPRQELRQHATVLTSILFLADDQDVLTGGQDDRACIHHIADGTIVRCLTGHRSWISGADVSPSKDLVATSSADKTVRLFRLSDGQPYEVRDPETGKLTPLILRQTEGVWAVRFSANGEQLATANSDFTVKLWDVKTGDLLRQYGVYDPAAQKAVTFLNRIGTSGRREDYLASIGGDGNLVLFPLSEEAILSLACRAVPDAASKEDMRELCPPEPSGKGARW